MSTTYLELLATQRPHSIGVDPVDRALMSFNVRAGGGLGANLTWENDLATLIQNAGLGTLWDDLFIGLADIPSGTVAATLPPLTEIIDTGGMATKFTAENNQFPSLSAQILVRAKGYQDAKERAGLIYELLNGMRNFQV